MRRPMIRALVLAVTAAAGATAPAARADILATVEVASPSGADLDLATVNAATGVRTALPPGINTAGDELHPSLSADGKRLVYERVDHAAGTTRIIVYDFSTGRFADLFDAFSAQQEQPSTPAISDDGSSVLTGRPLQHLDPSQPGVQPSLVRTSLATFPSGPFARAQTQLPGNFGPSGRTLGPAQRGGELATAIRFDGDPARGVIELSSATGSGLINEQNTAYVGHPALSGSVVVFERAAFASTGLRDLVFRTSSAASVATAPDAPLPALINTSHDESRPAFTADDRYLGFVRHTAVAQDLLFVFDTQTQTLLNPSGVDLGVLPAFGVGAPARSDGNLVLRQQLILSKATLTLTGLLTAQLLQATGVGILVQRIVGRHRVLGRMAYKLRPVGRVPFGARPAGRFRVRWDHRVGGKRLPPGRYLVTVRAVTAQRVVRELGRSFVVRIRRPSDAGATVATGRPHARAVAR
jgi:hypothetical protein